MSGSNNQFVSHFIRNVVRNLVEFTLHFGFCLQQTVCVLPSDWLKIIWLKIPFKGLKKMEEKAKMAGCCV